MDKEKSLLYSLFEKFTKNEEEKLEEKKLTTVLKDTNSDIIIDEKSHMIEEAPLNVISQLCVSFGFSENYSNGILNKEEIQDIDNLLENTARDYLNKKDNDIATNSKVVIYTSKDNLTASLFIFPAILNGEKLDLIALKGEISAKNIFFGIKDELLDLIINEERYCECIPFAFGVKPVNGVDGKILEFSKINTKSSFDEDEKGRVDFKKLNLENNILKDNLICKIIPPIDGVDGISVFGKKINAVQGKKVSSPVGAGTYIPENSSLLLAKQDGRLSFANGKYCVEAIFKLSGNVDNSTGNIDFVGDVVVMGDVKSGFEVKAGGSIIVNGSVGDCVLVAGNHITIKEGINSDNHGKITLGGDLNCKYIENCHITCGGNIKTGAIINSFVFSDGFIEVKFEKGTIVGGEVSALKSITANVIGSSAGRDMKIKLGSSYKIANEINSLREEIPATEKTLNMLNKNIEFLESGDEIPPEKIALLIQLKEQYKLYTDQLSEMNDRKNLLQNEIRDFSKCKLEANTIHPPCRLSIGGVKQRINYGLIRTTLRLIDGEIKSFTN